MAFVTPKSPSGTEKLGSLEIRAPDVVLSNMNRYPVVNGIPGYLLYYEGIAQSRPSTDTFIPKNLQGGQRALVEPYIVLRENNIQQSYTVNFSLETLETPTTFQFQYPSGVIEDSAVFSTLPGIVDFMPQYPVVIGPGIGWYAFVLQNKGTSPWNFFTCSITLIDRKKV